MASKTSLGFLVACAAAVTSSALAQIDPRRGPPGCIPATERRNEIGCYIVASTRVGELKDPVFWHLDTFPTRAEAEASKGPSGTVVEALGRVWVFTVEQHDWNAGSGTHIGKIGPLSTKQGVEHTASYLEAIMLPGAETSVHHHAGPEALFVISGEECMETPDGKLSGRPEGPNIIVPGHVPHRLTITGIEKRRSLGLILHESAQPMTIINHDHTWRPKNVCH